MNKNSEGSITGTDIHGRLEALDQNIRSIEGRLRAVERRLSYNSLNSRSAEQGTDQDYDIRDEIEGLSGKISLLAGSLEEMRREEKPNVPGEIKNPDMERRLERLENANKITIGKIKVPLELSGLTAAFALLATGFLISEDKWDIIRSSYYPITLGIIFGAVVIARFLITNRDKSP